jgi:hypothetical protein
MTGYAKKCSNTFSFNSLNDSNRATCAERTATGKKKPQQFIQVPVAAFFLLFWCFLFITRAPRVSAKVIFPTVLLFFYNYY